MELLSPRFLLFALLIVLAVGISRGTPRFWVFLGANTYFASRFLTHAGMIAIGLFCLAGYTIGWWILRGGRPARYVGPALLVTAFVYLRGYGLLDGLLPGSWIAQGLAPAGLSFVFFKILHVLIDASAGTLGRLRLGTYLNYCLNFTTFLLGPIQRYQDFDKQWHQLENPLPATFESHLDTMNRILRGLVKKFVLAEFLASHALSASLDVHGVSFLEVTARTYLFYFTLYCDFSGYCDIMIGLGTFLGVRPPENFWLPFLSRNITEFWMRVHRSLTLWLTDYVFNPCYARALRNPFLVERPMLAMGLALMTTMVVSGLWHGTTLNFLLFGMLHGVYLILFRAYEHVMVARMGRKRLEVWSKTPFVTMLAVLFTFHATAFAYLFFVLDAKQIGILLQRLLV